MPNAWVEFVRQYAKENNLSYGCAISEAGPAYRSMKKGGNSKKEKEEMSMMMGEDFDAPEELKITFEKKKGKSNNPWIDFVKNYTQENGIKYNESLKEIKRLNL
jgi:hypothetical protein